jgi:hypothetical protein
MKNLIIAVFCLFSYCVSNAQIAELRGREGTYDIYDANGKKLGRASSWSNCELMGYTSNYIVFQCSGNSGSTLCVYNSKGEMVAQKHENYLYGQATIKSITPSGITLKLENGQTRELDFNLNPKR